MVNISKGRKLDRTAVLSMVMIGAGATFWLWPTPQAETQVGPTLPTVSVLPSPATTSVPPRTTGGQLSTPGNPATELPTAPVKKVVAGQPPKPVPAKLGLPVTITIPFASTDHPNGVRMTVIPHAPSADGAMWIPGPEEGINDWANDVSWLNTPGYAAPFATHGAVIIAGHINWQGTPGALSDLSQYGADDVGRTLTVTMADGRIRTYRITGGFSIDKAQLAAEGTQGPLHTKMFGQIESYGPTANPTEELRLISCGGEYDPAARSYSSNIVVIARPIG